MLSLLLASSLWVAAQEAGARQDAPAAVMVPVEKMADDFSKDLAWVVGAYAADLYTTAFAIESGGVEANPLGPTPEARIALKTAGVATVGLTMWKLRRDGHGRAATIVRWVTVGIMGVFALQNGWVAIAGEEGSK